MIHYKNDRYLGYNNLFNELKFKKISPITIFEELLKNDMKKNKKKFAGAKAPFQIMRAQEIFNWFPDAKIIHLVRDPRAIASSYIHKKEFLSITNNKLNNIKINFRLIRLIIISYVIFCYIFTSLFHIRNFRKINYYLIRYEDLIKNNNEILHLFKWLEQDKIISLKYPTYNDSSYKKMEFIKSKNRWEILLYSYEKLYIWLFCSLFARFFNYR